MKRGTFLSLNQLSSKVGLLANCLIFDEQGKKSKIQRAINNKSCLSFSEKPSTSMRTLLWAQQFKSMSVS